MGKRKGETMIAADGAVMSRTMRDDPMLTPAQLAHQVRLKGHDGGKVEVDIRFASLIGGLCRMDRTPAEEQAAARYRGLWERAQIGGARALDYGQARVDTSGPSEAAVFETGEDARRGYARAVQVLGMAGSVLVERVVCHEMSLRAAARSLGWGDAGSARLRAERQLRERLGVLAVHFGFVQASAAAGNGRIRMAGERPATGGSAWRASGRRG